MRSRLLIGASAWLLGAVAATCGSMFAVSHLAHGLLGAGTQQLTSTDVSRDLASYAHSSAAPGRPVAAMPGTAGSARRRYAISARPQPASAPAGTLLVSRAGSAMATCQSGLAYLQYWSPYQGYQADDVLRGPAVRASLVFEGDMGVRMLVSCDGGLPVAQLSGSSDDHGDDGAPGGDS